MTDDFAKWNTKYMCNHVGKPIKIKEMSEAQVNNMLRLSKQKLKVISSNMNGLYERRFVILKEKGYMRKNHKVKIAQTLGIKTEKPDDRLKEILNLALAYLEQDKPVSLVKAILEQARDGE